MRPENDLNNGSPTPVGTNQVCGIFQQKRIQLLVEHLFNDFIVATDENHHRIKSHAGMPKEHTHLHGSLTLKSWMTQNEREDKMNTEKPSRAQKSVGGHLDLECCLHALACAVMDNQNQDFRYLHKSHH